jgi:hypothetical protein
MGLTTATRFVVTLVAQSAQFRQLSQYRQYGQLS